MPRYVFVVQLDRRPTDTDIDALRRSAGGGATAGVWRDERYAVLRYSRDAATLSHSIADTIAEITRLPGLQVWWTELYD